MNSFVFALAIFVLSAVVLVLVMMVFGAWTAVLIAPPKWLKWIAIQQDYAKPIAKRLTVEAIVLIGATAALILSTLQEREFRDNYRTLAANLICQVKATGTSTATREQIKALSKMKGGFQKTLAAYDAFLSAAHNRPSLDLVENLIAAPDKRTAYDLRLLGLLYWRAGEAGSKNQFPIRESFYRKAQDFHAEAIAALGAKPYQLPGQPDKEIADGFIKAIKVNAATIIGALGAMEIERAGGKLSAAAKEYLDRAASELDTQWREGGADHANLLNLVAVNALLLQDARADEIIAMVLRKEIKLADQELFFFRRYLADLGELPELKGYAQRKLKGEPTPERWGHYVESLFSAN